LGLVFLFPENYDYINSCNLLKLPNFAFVSNALKNINIFLFILLFAVKIAAIHTYSHCDNEEDETECSICITALENQQESFTFTDFNFDFSSLITADISTFLSVITVIYPEELGNFQCSRPPPNC